MRIASVVCWRLAGRNCADAGARRRHDARARAQRRQGAAKLAAAPRQLPGPPVSRRSSRSTPTRPRTSRSPSRSRLAAFEGAGTRYKFGNLEATPIVEDGIMYVPDGWGTVYAIDVSQRQEWRDPLGIRSRDQQGLGRATSRAAASTTAASRSGRTRSSPSRSTAGCSPSTRRPARRSGSARSPTRRIGETLTLAPLIVRDVAIVGAAGGEFGIRGFIEGTDLNTGQRLWRTYHDPGHGRGRQRDLEGRPGALETRRRLGLGNRHLRRRHRYVLSRHRQRGSGL